MELERGGVVQGISLLLFNVITDQIINRLDETKFGGGLANACLSHTPIANGSVLLSPY